MTAGAVAATAATAPPVPAGMLPPQVNAPRDLLLPSTTAHPVRPSGTTTARCSLPTPVAALPGSPPATTLRDVPPPGTALRDVPPPGTALRDVPPPGTALRDVPPPGIVLRDVPPRVAWALEQAGAHPLLARLLAARGVRSAEELDDGLTRLLPPGGLLGVPAAARLLADAIAAGSRICVVADYDCDGATACAVVLRGLKALGAADGTLGYVVPDRARHGYGLTPAIVDLVLAKGADLLITVDNGIASLAGVAHAKAAGLAVLVTDHHLPARAPTCNDDGSGLPGAGNSVQLPDADVIVNPNQPGCGFGSKQLAGVGVVFYVLLGLRAELRRRGAFGDADQPRLDGLLDLVALGTVADVVRLDANNRRLVAQGLKRVRAGRLQPGTLALFAVAGRDWRQAGGFDFGFALGPRLNAAGRLADMALGIECLLTDDPLRAAELAAVLDGINRQRRDVEAGMREQAEGMVDRLLSGQASASGTTASTATAATTAATAATTTSSTTTATTATATDGTAPPALCGSSMPAAVALYDAGFHEGVVGIVASRLKDRLHRPAFVFARGLDGLLKGSGRSIAGFHLRDALDLIAKRQPGLLLRFGGHAMAAGCTLSGAGFAAFDTALRQVAGEWLDRATLERRLPSDGPLSVEYFTVDTVRLLDAQVWGSAFEAPLFSDDVDVVSQRQVGQRHLKLCVRHAGVLRDAIWFGRSEPLPARVRLAYRLCVDAYEGRQRLQMVIEAAEATRAAG